MKYKLFKDDQLENYLNSFIHYQVFFKKILH